MIVERRYSDREDDYQKAVADLADFIRKKLAEGKKDSSMLKETAPEPDRPQSGEPVKSTLIPGFSHSEF